VREIPSSPYAAKPSTPPAPKPVDKTGLKIKLNNKRNQGFVNPEVLRDVVEFGRSLYQKGMDTAKWVAEMVRELGEKVRPYLRAAWQSLLVEKPEGGIEFRGAGIQPKLGKDIENLLNKATGKLKMRKSAMRASRSKAVPEEVREEIREAPESWYSQQRKPDIDEALAALSDTELLAVPKTSPMYVGSQLEAGKRLWNAGNLKEGYDVFMAVSADGTTFGQNINQFKRLKGASPLHFVRLVNEGLKEAGRDLLTEPQMQKLGAIAERSIDLAKQTKEAGKTWAETLTDEAAKEADRMLAESNKADLALQSEINKFKVKNWPRMFKAMAQGNPLTFISQEANVIGNVVGANTEAASRAIGAFVDAGRVKLLGGKRALMAGPIKGTAASARGFVRGLKESKDVLRYGSGEAIKGEMRQSLQPLVSFKKAFAKNPEGPTIGGQVPLNERIRMGVEGTFGVAPEVMLRLLSAADRPAYQAAKSRLIAEQLRIDSVPEKYWKVAEKFPELFIKRDKLKLLEQEAQDAIYQRDSVAIRKLNEVIKGHGGDWGDLAFTVGVAPYRLVPWNLVVRTMRYNPLVATSEALYHTARGNIRMAEIATGRMIVGGILYAAGIFLYKNGLVGPALDTRDESVKARILSGDILPPNYINLSGLARRLRGGNPAFQKGDVVKDITRIGGAPGSIIVAVANIGRSMEKLPQDKQQWFATLLRNSTLEQASFTVNQSFLKGATGVLDAIRNRNLDNYINNVENMLLNIPTPNLLTSISRATRQYKPDMQSDTLSEELKNVVRNRFGFAGFDDYLPLKRDLWGKPMLETPKGANALLYHFFDISKGKQVTSDPVALELYDLWRSTGETRVIPSIPERRLTFESYRFPLPPDKYEKYVELIGAYRYAMVREMVENPEWQAETVEGRVKKLDSAYRTGLEWGKEHFIRLNLLRGIKPLAPKAGFKAEQQE
jgi:hypothetical protein